MPYSLHHRQVIRPLYLILLHILGNKGGEFLAVFPCLPLAYALTALELVEADRIHNRHILKRGIAENHPRLKLQPPAQVLTKVLQHSEKRLVAASAAGTCRHRSRIIVIVLPFGERPVLGKHQRSRVHGIFPSLFRDRDEPVSLDVLFQKMKDNPLMDDSAPEPEAAVASGAESLQFIMLV